ncbi:MAG: LytTR family transcriptional regulator [Saprospiraceae bacterium]|nr:LytTR family transcriptional regulator [Candidatus Opimibacter iunctus]
MATITSLPVAMATPKENTFSIRVISRGRTMQIKPDQIIRLQACGNYTVIHAEASAPMMTAHVLKFYASDLHEFGFVRVNKADLVNAHKIVRLEDNNKVVMPDNYVSTIARRRKTMLRSLLVSTSLL